MGRKGSAPHVVDTVLKVLKTHGDESYRKIEQRVEDLLGSDAVSHVTIRAIAKAAGFKRLPRVSESMRKQSYEPSTRAVQRVLGGTE